MRVEESHHRAFLHEPDSGRRVLPLWPDRWYVLFGERERALWLPPAGLRLHLRCLRHFIGNPYKALYAKALLAANALLPRAGLLPETRLPRTMRSVLSFQLPVRGPWRAALQLGTPGPYQKISILLASEAGKELAFAKVAMAQSADAMVMTEASWLRELGGVRPLAGQLPELLAEGAALNGRRYLVTTLAPTTRRSNAFTAAHVRFLRALGRVRLETLPFHSSPCLQRLEQNLDRLALCASRDALMGLRAALNDCALNLGNARAPFVIAQGDFAAWNIRLHSRGLFVFDWEYASAGANPLADILNFWLMPRAASGRAIGLLRLAAVMRRTAATARQVYPEWNWSARVVSAFALAYLLEVILHYCFANQCFDQSDPVVRSYVDLVNGRSAWMQVT